MKKKRDAPLLPVHSRHMQKRFRRKGTCMRIVIVLAVVFTIGYAAFATRYIGTSKQRKDARDSLVRTQLERKSTIASGVGGAQNEGRSLKADAEIPGGTRKHLDRDLVTDPSRKRAELTPDFPVADNGAYDDVVAQDRRPGGNAAHRVAGGTEGAQRQQHAQAASPPYEQQRQHVSGASNGTVTAGPGETDREAEIKRGATVTAPSLAVGSHIESDRRMEERARTVAEPGASPITSAVIEPTSQQPVKQHAPIPVVHTEPDAQQAQRGAVVHEPVLAAPRETDSTQQSVPVKAPEDKAPVTGGSVTSPATNPTSIPTNTPTTMTTTTQAVPQPTPPAPVHSPNADTAPQKNPLAKGLYTLDAVDIEGKARPLSEYAGKITLIVNVASACGYTDENYKGLMKTYEKYRSHGFEILGFPCNQFGKQEPGSETEIKSFCSSRYHVTFPMFSKVDVNGPSTHPVYQYLKRELPESEGGGGGKGPGKDLIWNFQKILVNHEGRPVKLIYQSWDQGSVEQEIYRLLHEARAARATIR